MIDLMHPWVLLALPLPFLAWRLLPAIAANASLPVPAPIRNLIVGLSQAGERRLRGLPEHLWPKLIGWALIVLALAGPHLREETLLTPTGRDLIVAIDLSASMEEPDMELDGQPAQRHEVVRRLIGDFIRARKGDRVGLIAYGHEAFLIAPLSYDVDAVAASIDELTIGLPGHRTDLGRAIGLAVKTFEPDAEASRVLVLLSDGEDNSGELTGTDAADLAAGRQIRIHTIGFSSNIEADGADVLRSIAGAAGGEFFWARTSRDLDDTSRTISDLEPTERPEEEEHIIRDLSHYAVVLALAMMAWLVVAEIRTR